MMVANESCYMDNKPFVSSNLGSPMKKSNKHIKSKSTAKKAAKSKNTAQISAPENQDHTNQNTPQTQSDTPTLDSNAINQQLDTLAQQINQALNIGDWHRARQLVVEQVLPLAPNHPVALHHLAMVEYQLGNLQVAYQNALFALQQAQTDYLPAIYDTLIDITAQLHRYEEGQYYARLALAHQKNTIAHLIAKELPKRKRKGTHNDKNKNIISFALTGNLPQTCETAVINAALAQTIYPEWTCRFYIDDHVPDHIIERLKQQNAQIIKNPNPNIPTALWQLLVVSDPQVHCFMIRHVGTLLSYKEKAAVDAWLDSKKYFHLMHDSLKHHQPMLSYLWAGYTDAFDDITQLIQDFFGTTPTITSQTIQAFFNQVIYPTVASHALIHDSHHLQDGSLPYPSYTPSDIEKITNFHLGATYNHITTITLYVPEAYPSIAWQLINENRQIVCYYHSIVHTTQDNQFVAILNLPNIYGQHLDQGLWKIAYQPIATDV